MDNNKTNYGTFVYEGKTLTLIQQPYFFTLLKGYDIYEKCCANAIDLEGNEYEISWDVIDLKAEDDLSCDWNDYKVKKLY